MEHCIELRRKVETELWWRDPVFWGVFLWGAVVAAAGFPPVGFWPLVLLAPAPLYVICFGSPTRRAAARGWGYGLGFFTVLLWWIVPTLIRYGALPWIAGVVCLVLLAACLALYPALVTATCGFLAGRHPALALAVAPFLWTGAEWARGRWFSGFPWGDLPQALWRVRPALDLAPWCGIDGVRLLLACVAVIPAWCVLLRNSRRGTSPRPSPVSLLPGVMALLLMWVGVTRPAWEPLNPRRITVGIAQGNIDQDQKWDPAYREQSLRTYSGLTRRAVDSVAGREVELVVWPETSAPFYAQDPSPERAKIQALASDLGTALLFGAPAYERENRGVTYRNSVFLVDAEGIPRSRYDKTHLVPFGEYVPFGQYFPFVKKLVQGAGDFTPGPEVLPMPSGNGLPSLGPLVCFEVIFPELAEQHVAHGAQLLAVLTNDGWFGNTPGPYQHLAFAAWRAAENGVPLVRAANTGVSAVFDERGRMLRWSSLGEEAGFSQEIQVFAPHQTPQHRIRRWIGLACLILAAALVFAIFLHSQRQEDVA